MTQHEEQRHDEQLADLLAEADALAALEQSPLASCEECREIVAAHVELGGSLDDLGRDERRMLADAAAEAAHEPEGRAESELRRLIQREAKTDGGATGLPDRRGLAWLAMAAAAVVVVMFLLRDSDPGGGDTTLGRDDNAVLTPSGEVEDFSRFTWDIERAASETFEVVVYEPTDEGLMELDRSDVLQVNQWEPEPERHTAWPDEIVWRLLVKDSATVGSATEIVMRSARRSRR